MFTSNIDLGQIILTCIIAIIGWFIKREITTLANRLDKHDNILFKMVADIHEVKGIVNRRIGDKPYDKSE